MKKLIMGMSLAIAGLLFGGPALAQEDVDEAAEHIEQVAGELEAAVEEIGEKLEAWAEEHSEELEQWAEKYSSQWEEWAEGFEKKMESWAEQQEGVWEEWAESYSKKWEDWGEKLESGEFDPDEMGELIERNLEMLSDMPIGPMIEGLMKEGVGGLKDAPWESLNDLQDMFQDSLEQSLKGMEDMAKEGGAERLSRSSKDFNAALEKMQKGLDVKLKRLDSESDKRLQQLKELLAHADLTDEQRKSIRDMAETIKDAKVRKAAEMKDKLGAAKKAIAAEQKLSSKDQKAKSQDDEALDRFNEALKQKTRAMDKRQAAQERVLDEARRQRDTMKSKESDLDALRAEIKKLREEVKRLKKDQENN